MLENITVYLFCGYFFIYEAVQILEMYKDAAGLWNKDWYRPLSVAITNLVLSLLLVPKLGVVGVLIATIVSYGVIGLPWIIVIVFKYVFSKQTHAMKDHIIELTKQIVYTVMGCFVCGIIVDTIKIDGIIGFVMKIIVVLISSNVLLLVCNMRNVYLKGFLLGVKERALCRLRIK